MPSMELWQIGNKASNKIIASVMKFNDYLIIRQLAVQVIN